MPVLYPSYNPPLLYRNGHIHTIFSFLFRNFKPLNFKRSKLKTSNGDFLDLDQVKKSNDRCVILVHGLEGSSESGYITSIAQTLLEDKWDIAAINLRGCSGTDNLLFNAYHSGIIEDLDLVVDYISADYRKISLVGFSLGGNIVLKYMGYLGQQNMQKIVCAAAVSVPCHLSSSSDKLETWENYIYNYRFLKSLKAKLKLKIRSFPGKIKGADFDSIKTIRQLDEVYTGPANGFAGAEDYYTKCSSLFSLQYISNPTLLINAQDDPFLTELCMPYKEAEENNQLYFYAPTYGGHVGFLPEKDGKRSKHEEWILDFFSRY